MKITRSDDKDGGLEYEIDTSEKQGSTRKSRCCLASHLVPIQILINCKMLFSYSQTVTFSLPTVSGITPKTVKIVSNIRLRTVIRAFSLHFERHI